MKAVLLGLVVGALVVVDPFLTAYLLRDFSPLRDLPFLFSITAALTLGAVFAVRAFKPGLVATVIQDYYRYFPVLFLLAYQFTGVSAGPLDPTEIVIGVFMLLFLAGLFIRREQRFVSTPFNMLHLALGICIVVSLASEVKFFGFLKSFKPFVVFFLMVTFLPRENLTRDFLRWLLIFAMLSAAFCLVQELLWVTTQELLSVVKKEDLKRMFEDTPWGPLFRVPGLMVGYRPMALYLAVATMLSLSALLWRRETPPLLPRRWLLFGLVLIVPALVLTTAKDVLLGVSAALLLLLVLHRPTRLVPVALVGLAGALALLIATAIVPGNVDTAVDLTRTVPKTEQERIRLDRDSIEGFMHGPYTWTGRGIGAGARYTAHTLGWPAHNAFILAAAELGVAGLVVYLMIYGLVFARAVALNIAVTSGPFLPIVRGLLAVLVVVLVGAQFEAGYLDIFVWTIFATVEAIWFQVRRQAQAAAESPPLLGAPAESK